MTQFQVCSDRCFLLMAEGFSRSLDVVYGGLGISKKIAIFDQKNLIKLFSCKFLLHFLVIKSLELDPDPYGPLNAGSGSSLKPMRIRIRLRLGMGSGRATENACLPYGKGARQWLAIRDGTQIIRICSVCVSADGSWMCMSYSFLLCTQQFNGESF